MRSCFRCFLAACFTYWMPTIALAQTRYYGLRVGDFKTNAHGVRGTVYVANDNTLFITGFEYDGQGPDAFFWGDTTEAPTAEGFIIPNEKGSTDVLRRYDGENLILVLPNGKSTRDVKSLSVWCRKFRANFGSIPLPAVRALPAEKSLGPLPTLAHAVRSEDVVVKDAKTLFISQLYYDGAGPDAFFLAGTGIKPHSKGTKIPDEDGRLEKLRGYQGKDVTLRLPGDMTVFDVDWFGLYCIRFEQNFGHVMVPERPNVPVATDDLRRLASMLDAAASTQSRAADSPMLRDVGKYYGKSLGLFKTNAHEVGGSVFAASENTFYLMNFTYDGEGPDAYFWAGTTDVPSPNGFIVPDEYGTRQVLGKYSNRSFSIALPDGKKIGDVKWLSVWCRKFAVNFGYIMIPENFESPKVMDIGPLRTTALGVRSGSVAIEDVKTLFIPQFHYDGSGKDVYFLAGSGESPHANGVKVPDENGNLDSLKVYNGKDIRLRLPERNSVYHIDWLAVYCLSCDKNFGHVMIPSNPNVPADLKQLKSLEMTFDNCEELFPGVLHVSWKILGQDIYFQLAGRIEENEYVSFGRSGNDDRAAMVGADVAVAFYDGQTKEARVVDYYLSAKSQCSQGSGACPDVHLRGTDNTQLVSWQMTNGVLKFIYKRPLASSDGQDLSIPLSIPVSVVAAIGPLNSVREVAFHPKHYTKEAKKIHFGRSPPQDRCIPFSMKMPTRKVKPWQLVKIAGPTTFRAQIGPTGGDRGYTPITGIESWGLAWWINGELIPELTVRRGTNYTFEVEGGDDPSNSASYHPLYITNNPEGGGGQFLEQLGSTNHRLYAGIFTDSNQRVTPTGVGRLCEFKHKTIDKSSESKTFEDYKKTLRLHCNEGKMGKIVWMPDEDTPDLVYYQCFTHRNLGWKIHVVDADAKIVGAMGHQSDDASTSGPSRVVSILVACMLLLF